MLKIMRKYNFEEYRKDIKNKFYKNFEMFESKKTISRRHRKKEDMDLLLEMAKLRRNKRLETGKLKIIGDRKYKIYF